MTQSISVLGQMGNTGCSTSSHIHLQVSNSAGIEVDPFGWMPFPDSTYGQSKEADPWQAYNQTLTQPRDATSHYLWLHSLDRRILNNPDGPTIITSASAVVTATFPAQAYSGPYRIEMWDGLDSPLIENTSTVPLATLGLYAYDKDEQSIQSLLKPVQLEFKLNAVVKAAIQNENPDYQIYRWDSATNTWVMLDTMYDLQNDIISATSDKLGQFAVTKLRDEFFLPIIKK